MGFYVKQICAEDLRKTRILAWSENNSAVESVQFSSVSQSCLTLWNPLNCSTLGLPVHHSAPGVYTNSCLLSQWCHPTISSSVVSFSSHFQSFPASGSFQMSQFFILNGQSIGVSASTSVLPMNIRDWFPLRQTSCSPRNSQESSPIPEFKGIDSSVLSFLYSPTLTSIHGYWKNHSFACNLDF